MFAFATGHSQGGTVFLVLNSMLPEYNAKFSSAHLLAGVGYMEYFPDQELAALAAFTNIIYVSFLAFCFLYGSHLELTSAEFGSRHLISKN